MIAGNLIGTDALGASALPNQGPDGIFLDTSFNRIGTTGQEGPDDAIEANVISGNTGDGVFIAGASNVVAGNLVGTTPGGDSALPNRGDGVIVNYSTGNWIGVNSVYGQETTDQRTSSRAT